jgi:hypothetical protein
LKLLEITLKFIKYYSCICNVLQTGPDSENPLEAVKCIGICVKWNLEGGCIGYKCSEMQSISSPQVFD